MGMIRKKSNREILEIWVPIIISALSLVIAIGSVYVSVVADQRSQAVFAEAQQTKADENSVRNIINKEASFVSAGNLGDAISLFSENASIRDVAGGQLWHGQNELAQRYYSLPQFTYLKHEAIGIEFSQDKTYVRATADTVGTYLDLVSGKPINISSNQGEKWVLQKIDDAWKITSFTYNLP